MGLNQSHKNIVPLDDKNITNYNHGRIHNPNTLMIMLKLHKTLFDQGILKSSFINVCGFECGFKKVCLCSNVLCLKALKILN